MRHFMMPLAAMATLAMLAACGSSPARTTSAPSGAHARSCRSQYQAWQHGPARTAAKGLVAKLGTLKSAGEAQDMAELDTALKGAGGAAAVLATHPMPRCADPHGYWQQVLTRLHSGAANAGTAPGVGGLLLAMVPLKPVPGLLAKLGAELRTRVGVSTPFG